MAGLVHRLNDDRYVVIERIARALAKSSGDSAHWPAYVRQARAAIEAMREPTKAMVRAAYVGPHEYFEPAVAWDYMIAVALGETSSGNV